MDIHVLIPWVVALVALLLLLGTGAVWLGANRKAKVKPLPAEWALTARPVFSTDERRVYRQLREALPHHIVLSKLPLVRFCQPNDPGEVRYWYELLGSIHVTFAICSANGRVLAAIDLDTDRGNSRRVMQIKQAVLTACRVRYLRSPVDHLPSIAELQLLVPQAGGATRGPQPAPSRTLHRAHEDLAASVPSRRKERSTLWQDSGLFQDSFFAPDNRSDTLGNSEFSALIATSGGHSTNGGAASASVAPDDIAGVVVEDEPRRIPATRH